MSKYDLVFTLITIVYGLLLTELFARLHKLIRQRQAIQWHWFPLLVVWYLFLIIIKNWWDLALPGEHAPQVNIYIFLGYGHVLVLLYLIVSAVLPDSVPIGGLNLREYYIKNSRYFWGLNIALNMLATVVSLISHLTAGTTFNLINLGVNAVLILLTLVLVLSSKFWIHKIIVMLFVVFTCFEILVF